MPPMDLRALLFQRTSSPAEGSRNRESLQVAIWTCSAKEMRDEKPQGIPRALLCVDELPEKFLEPPLFYPLTLCLNPESGRLRPGGCELEEAACI